MSDFETSDFNSPEPAKVEREGLPPGYRMRADAHYVDSLTSSSRSDRAARETSRTAWADEPTRPAAQDRRLFDQLAEDVGAIESAASLLAGERSPLLRRVGLDLIKAQSARASWLLRAMALGDATETDAQPRRRLLRDVLAQLRDRVTVECRLMGVGLDVEVAAEAGATAVPEALIGAGVTGAILAQLGLVDGQEAAQIRVRALIPPAEGSAILIEISQDTAALPSGSQARFFDAGWVNRPGGWLSAIGAATARTAAERLGGGISLVTTERRGCVIRLTLP